MSNRADAKRFRFAQFAGIDQKPSAAEPAIKTLERKSRELRITKRRNDIALNFRLQERSKAKAAHALEQNLMIEPIPLRPGRDSPFLFQLVQSLIERQQRMRRRREAELAVSVKPFELGQKIQTQTARLALAPFKHLAAAQHKAKPRHPFQALVRRTDQKVDGGLLEIDRDCAKAAGGINDVHFLVSPDDLANAFDRVEQTGSGFTMDHGHMRH